MGVSSFNQLTALTENYIYFTRAPVFAGFSPTNIGRWNGVAGASETVAGGANELGLAVIPGPDTDSIFFGGSFTAVGAGDSVPANKVAYFDGTSWSALGTPPFDSDVTGLAYDFDNEILYAGSFDSTTTANRLSKWDGSSWTGMSGSFTINNYTKLALDSDGNLYLGFGTTLKKYTKSTDTWSNISTTIANTIHDVKYNPNNNRVYVIITATTNNVLYYDIEGNNLVTLGSTTQGQGRAIDFGADGNLYIATAIPGSFVNSIEQYNGSTFTGIYNHTGTSGVVTISIDASGNIIARAGNSTWILGIPDYSSGKWSLTSSTAITYGGPVFPIGPEISEPSTSTSGYTHVGLSSLKTTLIDDYYVLNAVLYDGGDETESESNLVLGQTQISLNDIGLYKAISVVIDDSIGDNSSTMFYSKRIKLKESGDGYCLSINNTNYSSTPRNSILINNTYLAVNGFGDLILVDSGLSIDDADEDIWLSIGDIPVRAVKIDNKYYLVISE